MHISIKLYIVYILYIKSLITSADTSYSAKCQLTFSFAARHNEILFFGLMCSAVQAVAGAGAA